MSDSFDDDLPVVPLWGMYADGDALLCAGHAAYERARLELPANADDKDVWARSYQYMAAADWPGFEGEE
jgi:hypothetical protein